MFSKRMYLRLAKRVSSAPLPNPTIRRIEHDLLNGLSGNFWPLSKGVVVSCGAFRDTEHIRFFRVASILCTTEYRWRTPGIELSSLCTSFFVPISLFFTGTSSEVRRCPPVLPNHLDYSYSNSDYACLSFLNPCWFLGVGEEEKYRSHCPCNDMGVRRTWVNELIKFIFCVFKNSRSRPV